MHIIQNNPYRIVGLLVGATAAQQNRHITRIPRFIDAEDEVPLEFTAFSFPALGEIKLSIESISDAASKFSLNSDKMSAGLFWFYNGNPITDEPAFDALIEGDLDQVLNIWTKLTSNGVVSQRNASAYCNFGTLYLSGILEGTDSNEALLEQGISLKLKFLESDFIADFKALTTDETYKATKKELQLLFLNQIQNEIEKSSIISLNTFLEILSEQSFTAKEDFLKGFAQNPIEKIERQVNETRKKQKDNPVRAGEYGNDLYKTTKPLLATIISILGTSDIKVVSIADKLANEILQCSITLFNHYHETDTEIGEVALEMNNKANAIALGNIVRDKINESTSIVEKYINDQPEREKIRLVKPELEFITSQLDRFETFVNSVLNAKELMSVCKPKLHKIKRLLSSDDEFYLNLSSTIAQKGQNMLVQSVNDEVEKSKDGISSPFGTTTYLIEKTVEDALEATYYLGTLDMNLDLKAHYQKNLEGIKSLAKQLGVSTLSPKGKLENELRKAESKLAEIENKVFFKLEKANAHDEMTKIRKWQFLRSEEDKEKQINAQQQKIKNLSQQADAEEKSQTNMQQAIINEIKSKIQKADY